MRRTFFAGPFLHVIVALFVATGFAIGQTFYANSFVYPIKETIKTTGDPGWFFLEKAKYKDQSGNTYYIYHPGWDINVNGTSGNGDIGTKIYAIADGTVKAADKDANNVPTSWGALVIEHSVAGKKYYSQYGHLRK